MAFHLNEEGFVLSFGSKRRGIMRRTEKCRQNESLEEWWHIENDRTKRSSEKTMHETQQRLSRDA